MKNDFIDISGGGLPDQFKPNLLKNVSDVHSMIEYVLATVTNVEDNDAVAYAISVDNRMAELTFLPEDRKIIKSVIADRSFSGRLTRLIAEDMRQNVVTPEAKKVWAAVLEHSR